MRYNTGIEPRAPLGSHGLRPLLRHPWLPSTHPPVARRSANHRPSFEMPQQSDIAVQGDMIVARVSGERPALDGDAFDELSTLWFRIAQECRRQQLGRILLVSTVTGVGSSAVNYGIFSDFDRFGLNPSTRIALVRTDARVRRIMELGVRVARTHGWQMELFGDEERALGWLRSPPSET